MLIFFTVNTVSCYVNNCMFAISDKIVINFLTILCVLFFILCDVTSNNYFYIKLM